MSTILPTDANRHPIPAMRLRGNGAQKIAFTTTSAHNTTPFDMHTRVISLYATSNCYIRFSSLAIDTAAVTDHFYPAGFYYDIAIGLDGSLENYKYVHVLRESLDGTLYISEKE